MVITITMRNYRIRNGIYWFRIVVPEDCREAIGKDEISFSLGTAEKEEAAILIPPHTKEWKLKFKEIRSASVASPSSSSSQTQNEPDGVVAEFQKQVDEYLQQHLDPYLNEHTEKELTVDSMLFFHYSVDRRTLRKWRLGLPKLQKADWPLPEKGSPGEERKCRKVLLDAINRIRAAIDAEVGRAVSTETEEIAINNLPPSRTGVSVSRSSSTSQETDIIKVMSLMLKAKNTEEKYRERIEGEIACLIEWFGGKSDITQYMYADLIEYVNECLPYIPKNMTRLEAFKGKSLRECVSLVKKHPEKYTPIAHKTCVNRFVGIQTVFGFAKDKLRIITVNPAEGIDIPVVRTVVHNSREFSKDELLQIWTKILPEAHAVVDRCAERYWSTILCLYHGFRQNEVCSLQIKDLYLDEDNVYVIRVREDVTMKGKSTKNESSNRIVPIHPYVLNELKFKAYVEGRKKEADSESMLFPNVTFVKGANFGKKVSAWFHKMKKKHLPEEAHHKTFHSLRHTFIQQAQNQAKMPDRYNLEITGHKVPGLSDVHLNYSGRLKPKDVLVELSKVKYGWEN
ncbi:site-specific integrase [Pontiellaceae bacterium B12227]|nr:site-specific integrase [Pontiellaceae bacterium B12227]